MIRTHKTVTLGAIGLVGLVALAAIVVAQGSAEPRDCPGKITCPITGEEVCRDKCPTVDRSRPDCPGRIVCPLSGKLVCKDRCPLDKNVTTHDTPQVKVLPCCAKRG